MEIRPDYHCFTWGELLGTGIDSVRLRNAMSRGQIEIGLQRRSTLRFFSLREMFVVEILRQLYALMIPFSQAADIAMKAGRKLENVREFVAKDRGTDYALIIRRDQNGPLIEYQRVDDRRTPGTIPCPADTFIRVSLTAACAKAEGIAQAASVALGEKAYA